MSTIEINNLTKDYGDNRGVFNLSLKIEKGETIGFVGTNGAGKTTTIRHIMGFLKPTSGSVYVEGLDAWKDSDKVKRIIGYVPGEIAFPDENTGTLFLNRQAKLLGVKSTEYLEYIIKTLQLDPSANLKRMSKGMKQKTAIAAALMHDAPILIMDEPTTGLDPLMRSAFIDLVKSEKKKGKTIFMSSHLFEEIEEVCDKVVLLKDGKIVAIAVMDDIKHNQEKKYQIEFLQLEDYNNFLKEDFNILKENSKKLKLEILVNDKDINIFIKEVKKYKVKYFKEIKYTLEQYFDSIYEGEEKNE